MGDIAISPQGSSTNTAKVLRAAVNVVLIPPALPSHYSHQLAKLLSPDQPHKSLRAIRYAKSMGWINFHETSRGITMNLTDTGKLRWKSLALRKPLAAPKWDKKWRLVLFDIPVKYKYNADGFRRSLKRLGLHQLQQSVWITPYPCLEEVVALRQLYEITRYVRLIEATNIEHEAELKQLFKL